jgi:DNA-binding MarR family transcriptional regulator
MIVYQVKYHSLAHGGGIENEDSVDRLGRAWLAAVPGAPVGEFPIYARLMRAGRLYRLALTRVAVKYGMSYRDIYLLMTLRRSGRGVTPTELIAELSITIAAIVKRIDRLEETGYITRRRDPEDGRSVRIELTAAGRRLVDSVRANRQPEFQVTADEFDAAEKDRFTTLLRRLLLRLEHVSGEQ